METGFARIPIIPRAITKCASLSRQMVSSRPAFPSGAVTLSQLKVLAPVAAFAAILLAPTPPGLTVEGQRVIAIMALAVILWTTQAIPVAVVGLISVVLLAMTGAVPDIGAAIYGFSSPVPYFMVAALTLGLAMQQTGLAQRIAICLIRLAGTSSRMLYVQMVLTFSALSFVLPNASTRISVLLPIYEDVMDRWRVPADSPLNQGVMMALGLLNIMASTAILAGGQIPLVASSLLGEFKWTQWFLLMSVPMYAGLAVGAVIIYFYYRAGFRSDYVVDIEGLSCGPIQKSERLCPKRPFCPKSRASAQKVA